MTEILLATRNTHKTREFRELLGGDFRVADLSDAADVPEIAETGATFEENAAIKALAISQIRRSALVVADDSGLEVEALDGAPGTCSARYAGNGASDAENVAKLLRELRRVRGDVPAAARFCCTLALASDGVVQRSFSGEVRGTVVNTASATGGFGYDPVFIPDGFKKTFAELGADVKNRVSHRAQAIAGLREYLASP